MNFNAATSIFYILIFSAIEKNLDYLSSSFSQIFWHIKGVNFKMMGVLENWRSDVLVIRPVTLVVDDVSDHLKAFIDIPFNETILLLDTSTSGIIPLMTDDAEANTK